MAGVEEINYKFDPCPNSRARELAVERLQNKMASSSRCPGSYYCYLLLATPKQRFCGYRTWYFSIATTTSS